MKNPIVMLRSIIGLSQQEFAERIGYSRSHLAKLETRQAGYENPSKFVRLRIAKEFGAIIESPESEHPLRDLGGAPYTIIALQKHRAKAKVPLNEEFPNAAIGRAIGLVGDASSKLGFQATFYELLHDSMDKMNQIPGFADELNKQIRAFENATSVDWIATTWLEKFFNLGTALKSKPKFVGVSSSGEPLFDIPDEYLGTDVSVAESPKVTDHPEPSRSCR